MRPPFESTILDIYSIIATYKDLIEHNDIGGLERARSDLRVHSFTLSEIYHLSNEDYIDAGEKLEKEKAESYKKYRDDSSPQIDATNFSKIDTIPLLKEKNKFKKERDKSKGLQKTLDELIIDISISIKNFKSQL